MLKPCISTAKGPSKQMELLRFCDSEGNRSLTKSSCEKENLRYLNPQNDIFFHRKYLLKEASAIVRIIVTKMIASAKPICHISGIAEVKTRVFKALFVMFQK